MTHTIPLTDLAWWWEFARAPAADTARQMRRIVHDLGALSRVSDAGALTRGHLQAFQRDLLAHHPRGTARKRFALAHALLQFGVDQLFLDTNPARRMTVPPLPATATRRCPFVPSDLTRIFSHPVFTVPALPAQRNAGGMAAYWLPLLLLCTGARLDEVAALRTCQLRFSNDTPAIPYWDFDGVARRAAACRPRPIHPILCRLGLLDYVGSRPPGSDLFPLLVPDRHGRRTAGFSTYFHRFLRQELGIVEPCKGIFSFRCTFMRACREAALSPDLACALHGSALPPGHRPEVDWPLAVLQRAMARLTFPGFPL